MKKFILTTLTILITSITPAFAENTIDDIVVTIDGMTCQSCVKSLTKVFNKEDSVKNIDVDLEIQTLTIDAKNGMTIESSKIKELIEWGGYDLISIDRK